MIGLISVLMIRFLPGIIGRIGVVSATAIPGAVLLHYSEDGPEGLAACLVTKTIHQH